MSVRLAVFDCDGTLVDGQADICSAMDLAFATAGLGAPDHHLVRRIVGLSLPVAIRELAPAATPEQCEIAIEGYKSAFRTARSEGRLAEPLFDGIVPLLHRLRQRGWTLGVATGKSDRGLTSCLSAHGIANLFETLQTADRHPSKPHPAMLHAALDQALAEPGNAVMIGDTHYDIAMARAVGVRAIGVAWGYHTAEELLAAGADAVAETPLQLGDMLA